jgi:hypothetical protein
MNEPSKCCDLSTPQVNARYKAAGSWHEIVVARDHAGRWQVLDTTGSRVTLVETLTGHDDRLRQAQALARDYAEQQRAYHVGEREADPLPARPEGSRNGGECGPGQSNVP